MSWPEGAPRNYTTPRDVIVRAANECLQMMGAPGYMQDYPLARYYHVRDARQLTIVKGTSQIQKEIIGRALADGLIGYW